MNPHLLCAMAVKLPSHIAPAFSALEVSWGRLPVLSVQDCAASLSVVSQFLSVCVPSGWLRMGATQQRTRLSGQVKRCSLPLCHRAPLSGPRLRWAFSRSLFCAKVILKAHEKVWKNIGFSLPDTRDGSQAVENMLNRKALVGARGIEPPFFPRVALTSKEWLTSRHTRSRRVLPCSAGLSRLSRKPC